MPSKYSIKSDLLAPSASKTIEYSGPNPAQVFKIMPDILMDVFRLSSSKIYEDEVKWDATSDPAAFYCYWRARDKKDNLTTMWVHVEAKGKQSKDKMGEVRIKIKGTITTSYKYSIPVMRELFRLYRLFFYRNQAVKYIEDANKDMEQLENAIRTTFDLMRKS